MTYQGSKSRIAKYIVPIIQKAINDNNINTYIEPCCGGLNIIDKIKCEKKFAYDLNKYLIYLFTYIKEGGELPEDISDDYYNALREAWYNDNKNKKFQDWEIGLLWLSSFSSRGPSGGRSIHGYEHRKDGTVIERFYYQERKRNILKQFNQPLCQDIIFGISDFKDLKNLNGCCIYMDWPYKGTKQYENSQYFNYEEAWDIMRQWSEKNIVLISELSAPEDFECIWQQEVSRSIKVTDKSKAVEKLFIYKG